MSSKPLGELLELYGVLIDTYYVLLALDIQVIRPLSIRYKGYEIEIPVELAVFAKAVHTAGNYLKNIERILVSPSRILEEEHGISNIVEGAINIPLTSHYIGRGIRLIAYSKRKLTYASPENLLLKAFYLRLYEDVKQLEENLQTLGETSNRVLRVYAGKLVEDIESFTRRMNSVNRLSIMREIVVEPKLTRCHELVRLAKIVLRRRHRLYHEVARQALEYCSQVPRVEVIAKNIAENIVEKQRLGLWDYKLYEVYTYYITAIILTHLLESMGLREIYLMNRTLVYKLDGKEYRLLYDEPIKCSSWLEHGKLLVDSISPRKVSPGRPDISLVEVEEYRKSLEKPRVLIVMDSKYTTGYDYISQSRYKILGYQNEYNTRYGALIFSPSKLVDTEVCDQEDEDFKDILTEVIDKGGGVIVDDKHKIYFIPLDPQPYINATTSKSYQLLLEALKESLET